MKKQMVVPMCWPMKQVLTLRPRDMAPPMGYPRALTGGRGQNCRWSAPPFGGPNPRGVATNCAERAGRAVRAGLVGHGGAAKRHISKSTWHIADGRRRPQAHIVGAAKLLALAAIMLGLSYTAVPLYQIFCQTSGFGGTAVRSPLPLVGAVPTARAHALGEDGGVPHGGTPPGAGEGPRGQAHGDPREGAAAQLPPRGSGTLATQHAAPCAALTINFAADVNDHLA